MILAGDIGGTNARLTLVQPRTQRAVRTETFPSRSFSSLEAVIRRFLGPKPPKITAACLGVAGPVVDNRCTATNLPWVIDGRRLGKRLGIPRLALLNDLVATAYGILTLPSSKLRVLHGGRIPKRKGATLVVLAAGTGLGEAGLVWDSLHERFVPCPTEGGHVEFAPQSDVEMELLAFLRTRFGHVSYERIVSGPGIGNLYDFFRTRADLLPEPPEVTAAIESAEDRNAAITELALEGRSEPCKRAVETFVSVFGAEAGNLALKYLAMGGVFIAGSLANRLLEMIEHGGFVASFLAKGRFAPLLEKIPVAVVRDPDVGLAGSIHCALLMNHR